MARREVGSALSAQLIEHLLSRLGMTQVELAERLGVSAAFISRVRRRERSLTIDHLETIEDLLELPLGAILMALRPPRPASKDPRLARVRELAREAMTIADGILETARQARAGRRAG